MIKKERGAFLKLPITILTKKLPNGRQNSVFYAGKDIASIQILNREYFLTTTGTYRFHYTTRAGSQCTGDETSPHIKQLTDHKIRVMNDNDDLLNWGWFTIEVNRPVQARGKSERIGFDYVFTNYDEALEGFIKFLQKELGPCKS